MKKPKGTGLKCVPINDINLIPRYLVEQIKDREFTVDRFYEFAPFFAKNQYAIIWAFSDKENMVKGFLLGQVNPLDEWIHVSIITADKEYFSKGIVKEATNLLKKKIQEPYSLKGIKFKTTRPAAFEKAGFKKSKHINMELV